MQLWKFSRAGGLGFGGLTHRMSFVLPREIVPFPPCRFTTGNNIRRCPSGKRTFEFSFLMLCMATLPPQLGRIVAFAITVSENESVAACSSTAPLVLPHFSVPYRFLHARRIPFFMDFKTNASLTSRKNHWKDAYPRSWRFL